MKTAIELVDEFPEQNPGNFEHDAALRLNDWGIEAHAMLRQQAEQIEHLRLERDALIALSEQVAKERDALKALVDNPRNTPFGKEAEKLADDWLAANAPGGWIDDLRNKCEALEITNAALKAALRWQPASGMLESIEALSNENLALKADAERLDWLSEMAHKRHGVTLDYGKYVEDGLVLERGYRVTYYHKQGDRQPTFRAAIDAMKGTQS